MTQRVFHPVTGKPVGSFELKENYRRVHDGDVRFIRDFLCGLCRDEDMAGKQQVQAELQVESVVSTTKEENDKMELKNQVVLAGKIENMSVKSDNVWILINAGPEGAKKVSTTAHEKEKHMREGLLDDLAKFREGDPIIVRAYVRPWSKKDDEGNWYNNVDIRIIDVKKDCIPANRQPKSEAKTPEGW